jgi:6-phospho-beta-glucosidase
MKLVVIGGAGVRAPLLIPALAKRQDALDLQEVVLMDDDEEKLGLIAPICAFVAERQGARFVVRPTLSAREALTGADAVITTIRAGTEEGRVKDERIALSHGVLGQETTGPGGFAMALRSIPAVVEYARLMRELCPDAWLMNFTNPAGLVAQALTEEFPDLKVAGICDTPSSMHRQLAAAFGRPASEVPVRVFGLNHLSWLAEAWIDGENVVPRLINSDDLYWKISDLTLFDPSFVRLLGMVPNEYLYFWYYRDRAVANIQAAAETRGEQVLRLSSELVRDLAEIDPEANPEPAWRRYHHYLDSRHGTYLAMEKGGQAALAEAQAQLARDEEAEEEPHEGGEGYAGVALDILMAARDDTRRRIVANVPNRGAIEGMADDDVVETVCEVHPDGLHTVAAGDVPTDSLLLMQAVKRYERLTVQAVRERSRELAVEALLAHPLVGSYPTAVSLVNDYLAAHAQYVGEWA